MSRVIVYVEGGGDTRGLQVPLREGFHELFQRALGDRDQPRIIACGGRSQAFRDFKNGSVSHSTSLCILLIDGEAPMMPGGLKWDHLRDRVGDGWSRPAGADEASVYLMVQAMETWIVADPEALATYYGQDFNPKALPHADNLETVARADVNKALNSATAKTARGAYVKAHGLELIGKVDPTKVRSRCPLAEEFFTALNGLMAPRAGTSPGRHP